MEIISKSFRGSSLKLVRRSNRSTRLVTEAISSECARIAGYERLSGSTRMSSGRDVNCTNEKRKALGFMSKVFVFKRISGGFAQTTREGKLDAQEDKEEKKKKKKKWSSWLPDPERRWPVQGW